MHEARLIQRAKREDPAAFAGIYDRCQPAVYRYIFYRVGEVGTAEDLTGEVFVRLVERIDRCPQQASLLVAWLHSIAEDLVKDRYPSARQAPLLHPEEQPAVEATARQEVAKRRLTPQRLAAAVAHLTPEQAQVILLKCVDGLDDETVAWTLGKPVDAIQSLGQEALAGLAMVVAWQDAVQAAGLPQGQGVGGSMEESLQNLAHELRSPLSLIQGYTELLLRGTLGMIQEEQRDALGVIHDQTRALSRLIHNLTALRGIPQEAMVLAPLSVPRWVESTVDRCRSLAAEAGVQLETDLVDELPPIFGDAEYLRVALSQMLENAIKFSTDGGVVRLRAWADESWTYVAVEDQGIGIAEEHLDRVFDPLYQVNGSITRHFGGAGLGLAVVRAVVEAHGGRVWAASEGLGRGSTFTLALPVEPTQSPLPSRVPSLERPPGLELGLSHALDACLLRLQEGQATLEECLAGYPNYATDLRPLLEIALRVRRAVRPASSQAAFAAGKQRMLEVLGKRKPRQAVSLRSVPRYAARFAALVRNRVRPSVGRHAPVLRLALRAALALALLATSVFSVLSWLGTTVAEAATLAQAEGVVEIMPAGSDAWQPVSVGARLEMGDRIRTGQLSTATLVFFDGSLTHVEAETGVTLAQMSSRRDSGGIVILVNQWIGYTRHRVQPLPDLASRFEVETPSAVATVTGTEFAVAVEADGTTHVMVAEGVVNVSSEEATVAVRAGQETVALPEEAPLAAGPMRGLTPGLFPTASPTHAVQGTPYGGPTAEPTQPPGPSGELQATRTPASFLTSMPAATRTPRPTPTRERPTPTPMPPPTATPRKPPTPPPTATPTGRPPLPPTATPTLTPTATYTPTPTATETLTPTVTYTPVPTATETLTKTVAYTPTSTVTDTLTSLAASGATGAPGQGSLRGGPALSLVLGTRLAWPTDVRRALGLLVAGATEAGTISEDRGYAPASTGPGRLLPKDVFLRAVATLASSAVCGLGGILGRGISRTSLPDARCRQSTPARWRRKVLCASQRMLAVDQRQSPGPAIGGERSRLL